MEEFDYLVLGGGSAGCVVASRLSEDSSVTVCLVEAGGDGTDVLIRAPLGFAAAVPRRFNNWQFQTVPQAGNFRPCPRPALTDVVDINHGARHWGVQAYSMR